MWDERPYPNVCNSDNLSEVAKRGQEWFDFATEICKINTPNFQKFEGLAVDSIEKQDIFPEEFEKVPFAIGVSRGGW